VIAPEDRREFITSVLMAIAGLTPRALFDFFDFRRKSNIRADPTDLLLPYLLVQPIRHHLRNLEIIFLQHHHVAIAADT
jgi:hypothetical protein